MNPRPPIGASESFRKALERAESAAASDVPLLLLGESGTGKEVVARHVHAHGPRATRPFLAVNAAALPFQLLESELFGHERGAFTGADRPRAGVFREAAGGTLLIDEIGDLPVALQAKLLRVLQEGEVRPVGAARSLPVDVRVVAATHRDLPDLVRRGLFREDLYYRVGVFTVELPALRERRGDIAPLARHFLKRHGRSPVPEISAEALQALAAHSWPGNVRELENACRHALVLCPPGGVVGPQHLPASVLRRAIVRPSLSIWEAREGIERERIERALLSARGNRTQAARQLGMSRQALHDRLRRYGFGPGAGRPGCPMTEEPPEPGAAAEESG